MNKILLSLSIIFLGTLSACSKADETDPVSKNSNSELPGFTHGIPLWGGALSGMSPEEVLTRVKNSHWFVHLNPSQQNPQVLVRYDQFEWLDKVFTVSFSFQSCQLVSVNLISEKGPKNFSEALIQSTPFIKEITDKFGTPNKPELTNDDNFKLYNIEWIEKEKRVGLGFAEVFGSEVEIMISFGLNNKLLDRGKKPDNKACWPPQSVIDSLYPKPKPYGPKNPPPPVIKLTSPPPPASVLKRLKDQSN